MTRRAIICDVIRQLLPSGAAACHALRLRGLRAYPQAFNSSFEQESDKPLESSAQRLAPDGGRPHDFFPGAFVGTDLCGMVGLQGRYRPKERHNASVVGMFVAPEVAGRGVGKALLQELIARARILPELVQLDPTVTAGNGPAQTLYANPGFVEVGRLQRAIRVGNAYFAKVHMALQLR
ncbi:MAG: GNAT family N-acetyltransferase [Rhodoferax sp.]|nr:GNAT family N-acetyltransferase [Rhodoferax sp.]